MAWEPAAGTVKYVSEVGVETVSLSYEARTLAVR